MADLLLEILELRIAVALGRQLSKQGLQLGFLVLNPLVSEIERILLLGYLLIQVSNLLIESLDLFLLFVFYVQQL